MTLRVSTTGRESEEKLPSQAEKTWTFKGVFSEDPYSIVGASIGDPFEGAGMNCLKDLEP